MSPWRIALIVTAFVLTPVILYRLHRTLLRWEERGWIYYWHKRPQSGAMNCFSAIQQAIEPGYEHVAKMNQERRDQASEREVLLAKLLSRLQSEQIDIEAIRELLAGCTHGEWASLYADAVRLAWCGDLSGAASLPTAEDVRPL